MFFKYKLVTHDIENEYYLLEKTSKILLHNQIDLLIKLILETINKLDAPYKFYERIIEYGESIKNIVRL